MPVWNRLLLHSGSLNDPSISDNATLAAMLVVIKTGFFIKMVLSRQRQDVLVNYWNAHCT